jgi:hypothetical protein
MVAALVSSTVIFTNFVRYFLFCPLSFAFNQSSVCCALVCALSSTPTMKKSRRLGQVRGSAQICLASLVPSKRFERGREVDAGARNVLV